MLALIVVAVVLPTAALLWYMTRALHTEADAARLRLLDAYRSQMQTAAPNLLQYWRLREEAFARQGAGLPPSERFAAIAGTDSCDSVVILNPSGVALFPEGATRPETHPRTDDEEWARARQAEFEQQDFRQAARLYEAIARRRRDVDVSAQAWQGQARSLLKAGDTSAALATLTRVLAGARYRGARDEQGRLIQPSALLLALERTPDRSSSQARDIAGRLEAQLLDYSAPILPSSQRRFLWQQLLALVADRPEPRLRSAEELAAAYLGTGAGPPARGLAPAGLPGVWAMTVSDGTLLVLLREKRVTRDLEQQLRRQSADQNIRWEVVPPGAPLAGASPVATRRLEEPLRDWQVVLRLSGTDPFAAAARQRELLNLGIAGMVIASIALLTILAGGRISRQLREARLKDDLLATVSHELKTPLSSMRVLVETLLDGDLRDPQQTREYLEIVRTENQRLSGLIESFLTFSRIVRGRHVFTFARVIVPELVERAVGSLGDRLRAPGCRFEMALEPGLPPLEADPDALVTVLLNLLDNALKYSGSDKHIVLRGYSRNGRVCLEVEDNGVGFSRRVARKIFERFFQADRSVAGSAAGVGLGLSIVKSIVSAHHGTIDVASQPGKGSCFTVCLPPASGG